MPHCRRTSSTPSRASRWIILDTHVLLWSLLAPKRLSPRERGLIEDREAPGQCRDDLGDRDQGRDGQDRLQSTADPGGDPTRRVRAPGDDRPARRARGIAAAGKPGRFLARAASSERSPSPSSPLIRSAWVRPRHAASAPPRSARRSGRPTARACGRSASGPPAPPAPARRGPSGFTSRFEPSRHGDRPLGVLAQRQARDAEVGALFLHAAGVGDDRRARCARGS